MPGLKKTQRRAARRTGMHRGRTHAARATRILFAASEVYPLVKTGGLADVACYLPIALREMGHDVRVVLPAYRSVLRQVSGFKPGKAQQLVELDITYRLLQGKLPGNDVPVYLVDIPELYDRAGDPYRNPAGQDWDDNARRYAAFGAVIRALAQRRSGLRWRPDIVHCNDWHTGLAPALLSLDPDRPATVFTIHNLAYLGDFSHDTFQSLHLPEHFWSPQALEFYGRCAFIKGGLVYADRLTAVSPAYAKEIQSAEFGYGLEGLLRHRRESLIGILNGVDYRFWDPRHDPLIARHYWVDSLAGKLDNKRRLQQALGLAEDDQAVLLAHISRLTRQKGVDLILDALHDLMQDDALQLVVLGSGERHFEHGLREAAQSFPGRLSVNLTYDESLAHRIQAGADILLMPSRYEPCGLTQMYSLRYGTIPVVRKTGGLADTIVNATPAALHARTATGFCFEDPAPPDLLRATRAAVDCYRSGAHWRKIMQTAMLQDFTWRSSAERYARLYHELSRPTPRYNN
jgi:starch synthase